MPWPAKSSGGRPTAGQPRAEKLAADFQKANPGITIKLEITTSNGLPQRILTALQSGAAPDIIEVQHPLGAGLCAERISVLPLDDVIQDKDDYNKAAINYDTYDGKLWGIPYRIECVGVMYNLGDFKAAGLDPANPPQTWDQLGRRRQEDDDGSGKFGMAITGGGEVGNTITRLAAPDLDERRRHHQRRRQDRRGQLARSRRRR